MSDVRLAVKLPGVTLLWPVGPLPVVPCGDCCGSGVVGDQGVGCPACDGTGGDVDRCPCGALLSAHDDEDCA